MLRSRFLVLGLVLALAACGTRPGERAVSGGGIGAALGAVLGAVTGLTVLEGALLAAGAGAAVGGFTDPESVNLGEPIWKQYATVVNGNPTPETRKLSNMVAATQANLVLLGYQPGPVDGHFGPRTRAALRQYQRDNELPVNGELSAQVALDIDSRAAQLSQ